MMNLLVDGLDKSEQWTEGLTDDYWSLREAQGIKHGKEEAEVFEDDFTDLINKAVRANLRNYQEINQDLKEEAEAFDDDIGEEDFRKKQMEEANKTP